MEIDSGDYLNVTIKNKLIQTQSILDYIKYFENEQKKIKDELIGRSFKVLYTKRNYIIDDIIIDRNLLTQSFNYEGKTIRFLAKINSQNKMNLFQKNIIIWCS